MAYVMLGAGAIGASIGARLFQHGHDVTLVARGSHHDALLDQGLVLRTPEETVVLPIAVVDHPARLVLGADDVVVLATKTQDSTAALDALAAAAPDVAVVCAQNGVENERLALRRFPRVHGMSVALPATHLDPGVVELYASPVSGILDVGRYPSGTEAVDDQLAADLNGATFVATADDEVMGRKYAKLLLNLANVLEAACGAPAWETDLYARARAEAEACYAAAGIEAKTADDAERRKVMSMHPIEGRKREGGSTWQSLTRGTGTTEVDFLNGEIVLLGRRHDVPTPVNAVLQRVGRRMAVERRAPGSLPVEEVLAELT